MQEVRQPPLRVDEQKRNESERFRIDDRAQLTFLGGATGRGGAECAPLSPSDVQERDLQIGRNTTDFTGTPLEHLADDGMFRHFRPIFTGTLIANVAMTAERGNRLIDEGLADMVAFGRPFIANPDLVARIAKNAPLAEIDWATVYAAGPEGYVDYPAWRPGQPA